jgi:hypothetical protein
MVPALVAGLVLAAASSRAQNSTPARLELTSEGETIVLEPYAPNIIRVTLSKDGGPAKAAPGYGIVGKPDAAGWSATNADGADVYRSDRMIVTVNRPRPNPSPSS